ncbi:MAG: hypothetical protein CMP23_02025 [Rickettsiales bacterium]|nr:hypothetical protein [Rickettsiales bacterium]|tara:strand:+ start:2952 stop:3830 length:879 start_codon:yes stop_codon:yes gene_type:complete
MRTFVPSARSLTWLLTVLMLVGPGCSEQHPAAADDDDSAASIGDDDDSATNIGDDDDSAASQPAPSIRFVTFAATMTGTPEASSQDGAESTLVEGQFQFIYWSDIDSADIVCRQRFSFDAVARFGAAQASPCEGCGGQLSIMAVSSDGGLQDDSCPVLDESVDLSFLLSGNDVTTPADFRELSLVELSRFVDGDILIGRAGLGAEEIRQGYLDSGLDAYWIAMVGAEGWLDGSAALTKAASPWNSSNELIPMFVAYRNPQHNPHGWALDGDCFLATLWAVRVGEFPGTTPLP